VRRRIARSLRLRDVSGPRRRPDIAPRKEVGKNTPIGEPSDPATLLDMFSYLKSVAPDSKVSCTDINAETYCNLAFDYSRILAGIY
jgi:hypothetical protein